MNASISLEAFGSPLIPMGLMRVLEMIRPGDNAAKIAAGRSAIAVNQANHRQRVLGNLPLGKSRSKNTIMPRPKTHTHEVSQANASPAGSDRDGTSKAYAAYSALKWDSPKMNPIVQNSHPR